jgi:hypothetical protein
VCFVHRKITTLFVKRETVIVYNFALQILTLDVLRKKKYGSAVECRSVFRLVIICGPSVAQYIVLLTRIPDCIFVLGFNFLRAIILISGKFKS